MALHAQPMILLLERQERWQLPYGMKQLVIPLATCVSSEILVTSRKSDLQELANNLFMMANDND